MAKPFLAIGILLVLISVIQLATLYSVKRPFSAGYRLPKLIWVYWDNEELPPIIEKIKRHNSRNLTGWTVIYLNSKTLSRYVSSYPRNYETISVAAKSDWLRLYLLSMYGGCWMDAGIVVNNPTAMLDLYNEALIAEADLVGFQTGSKSFLDRSGRTIPKLIDSWCIMAPVNSRLIRLWRTEFERAIATGFLAYKQEVIKRGVDLSAIYFEGPDDTYLTVHISIQAVVQNRTLDLPPLLIKQSSESMFRLQEECKGDLKCFAERFNRDPNVKRLPYIKLSRHERRENLDGFFGQA